MATSSVISSTRFICRPSSQVLPSHAIAPSHAIVASFSRDRRFLLMRLPLFIPQSRSKGAAAASSPAQSCTWARHNFSMQKMMDLLLRVIVDDNRIEPPNSQMEKGGFSLGIIVLPGGGDLGLSHFYPSCFDVPSHLRPPIPLNRAQFL